MSEEIVINAQRAVLGRLSSYAAKNALKGKTVVVINCENAIVTGNKRDVIETFQGMRKRGGSAMKGPNYPSNPSRIVKRTIRGMLPYKQGRGLLALKRVRCYDVGFDKVGKSKVIMMESKTEARAMSLKELCQEL